MESNENSLSAIEALDNISFKVGLKGYNVDEVDEFFDRLTVEVHQLKDLVAQQRQQLRQAAERINQLDARPAPAAATGPTPIVSAPRPAPAAAPGAEQVTSMIAMAQQFIDQAQHEAEEKARELTTAAQERAREIITEARSRAEDEVNRLNGLKQRLSEDVETLNRQLETERTRLSAALAEFSRWVEASLQPASTRAASQPAPAPAPAPAPTHSAPVSERPATPPPAPAPASTPTIGQTLNFGQSLDDNRN